MRTRARPRVLALVGLLAGWVFAAPVLAASDPSESASARGLIVRLKNAAPHTSLASREQAAGLATAETERWQRVLDESGLSGKSGRRAPGLRPVGRDQQLLQFERRLSRTEVAQLREKLMQRSDVEWVEANTRERRLQVPPTDPLFAGSSGQWWLQSLSGSNATSIEQRLRGVAGFQNAWARFGAPTTPVVVAVLDTGITTHPDLVGRTVPGYDFVSDLDFSNDGNGWDNDPSDPGDWVSQEDLNNSNFDGCFVESSSWHGTIVAGMVAANTNNGRGGAGVDWQARILPVRVAGKCGAEVSDIIDGMYWAAGLSVSGAPTNPNPARVVSISFGGSASCGAAYQEAVADLKNAGVVVVAAVGNEWSSPTRPANCSGVVGVVGLNRDGFKTNYSNFGARLAARGIATVAGDDSSGAWGSVFADTGLTTLTNLGTTVPGRADYARVYGTSFAVPQVSGTIALMLGLNPRLSYAQIVDGLKASARPHVTSPKIGQCSVDNPGRCICTEATCGVGILDAEQALAFAQSPTSYVAPSRQAAVIDNDDVDRALALADQDRVATVVTPPSTSDGDGGGAFGGFWLLALATAALTLPALRTTPRR